MSFTTPQSVTYNAVAKTCNRITSEANASVYKDSTGEFALKLSHQESKSRIRHLARVDRTVVAADPLTAVNAYQSAGVYIVIDKPLFGFVAADLSYQVEALKSWLTAGNISALLEKRH